jgi:hypothetical protein
VTAFPDKAQSRRAQFHRSLVSLIYKESVNKSLIFLIRVIVRDTGPFHTKANKQVSGELSALLSDGGCRQERVMSEDSDS